jgi:hypothetical protein
LRSALPRVDAVPKTVRAGLAGFSWRVPAPADRDLFFQDTRLVAGRALPGQPT